MYEEYRAATGDKTPTVIASTASPFKFAGSVLPALGEKPQGDDFDLLWALAEKTQRTPPPALTELKNKQERFTAVVEPKKMKDAVAGWLDVK